MSIGGGVLNSYKPPKNKVNFWKKLSLSIKKLYRKLKYLDKTKATYFGVSIFLAAFCLFTGGTYSYFMFSEHLNAAIISIAKLNYLLTSTNSSFKNNSITVAPKQELKLTLNLKSLNDQNTKYALDYITSSPDVKVYYKARKEQNVEGEIGGLNSVIDINLVIENTGDTAQTVNFDLKGGYLQNELESNIIYQWTSTIMAVTSSAKEKLWAHKANVQKIVFEDVLIPKENAEYTYDISSDQDGNVMSYLVPSSEDNTKFIAYIQSTNKVKANKNSSYLFNGFTNLESIENLSLLDTSKVDLMLSMFNGCSSLTTLDLSGFSTSKVGLMFSMFNGCSSLTTLDISGFDTSNVTHMGLMFNDCSSLTTLDISGFDTSNVTDMNSMFSGCSSLTTLDVSRFNTSKVALMFSMFYGCSSLTTLDVSGFDTSNVTHMSLMFNGCSSLTTLDISGFDTSNVTGMNSMFSGCSSLTTLDVSGFDTSNVADMYRMFYGCSSLTTLDVSEFDTSNVTTMYYMFDGCNKLSTTITIIGTNCTDYRSMFIGAATVAGSQIKVKYTADASDLVDRMIATKSYNSNVVKESQPEQEYTITLSGVDNVQLSSTQAYRFKNITLNSTAEGKIVTSFKMNGELIHGNSFKMPGTDVTISDVVLVEPFIVESEHSPYPNSLNNKEYLNKTFEGAQSLTVILEYQTESASYDYIYLYDKNGKQYGKYGGSTRTTETITIPGDTLRITFRTDGSGNNYYGFKATIMPNR